MLRWQNVSETFIVDLHCFLAWFITRDKKFQKVEGLGLELPGTLRMEVFPYFLAAELAIYFFYK